jgi:hypothetical protein
LFTAKIVKINETAKKIYYYFPLLTHVKKNVKSVKTFGE